MAKFRASYNADIFVEIEIEADNEEEANNKLENFMYVNQAKQAIASEVKDLEYDIDLFGEILEEIKEEDEENAG